MLEENLVKEEIESQFILRLPPENAVKVSKYIKKKPSKVQKHLKIFLDPETRVGEFIVRKKVIPMTLVDLPCIVESLKTINKKIFFKTADICQMLVPLSPEENNNDEPDPKQEAKKHLWKHGITPSLKNVRKQRFRRVLKNEQTMSSGDIEKELRWLLKMDNEAIAVRWELIDDPDYKDNKRTEAYYQEERDIFGDILTESSETDSDDSI